jgi:hypothetical protein
MLRQIGGGRKLAAERPGAQDGLDPAPLHGLLGCSPDDGSQEPLAHAD